MATLSDKQKRFVDILLADEKMGKKEAAIEAGYNVKNAGSIASQTLAKPHVKEYMRKRIEDRSARTEITQDYVLRKLVKTLETALAERPTVESRMGKDGKPQMVEKFKQNLTVANNSIALMGKHLGIFTEQQEITHTNSLEQTLMEIAKENAANRKSLLPKDNIDFDNDPES